MFHACSNPRSVEQCYSLRLQRTIRVQEAEEHIEPTPQAVVRSLPVLSDPLSRPIGGLQGLAWFLGSLVCDEWGQPANEILQESPKGVLQRIPGRVVSPHGVTMDCTHGVVTVQLAGQKATKSAAASNAPSKPKGKAKGKGKGKSRAKNR